MLVECRFNHITSPNGKEILRNYAVGWCNGENLFCRPKADHIATMFYQNGYHFWFHLRRNEFYEVFCEQIKE